MTVRSRPLGSDMRGSASVEFVLAAPVIILMIVGMLQIGMLGLAKAGLGQAVEVGARYATIYPRPTDSQISAKVRASSYGMRLADLTGPTFAHGTTNGSAYIDITATYAHTFNFGFFRIGPVRLTHTRRAYQV